MDDRGKHITKENIKNGLKALGLKKGDIVIVHSSLSAFGEVEGGPDAVIDGLLETVDSEGTVIMPTYSTNRKELEDGSRAILPFDPEKTPVWTGTISEAFRKRKGVIRSTHPTHSLAATGPKANEIIETLQSLVDHNGYVLLIGVGLEANSAMHIAEGISRAPQYMERLRAQRACSFLGMVQYLVRTLMSRCEEVLPGMRYVIKHGRSIRNKHYQKHTIKVAPASKGPWADLTKMDPIYKRSGIMKTAVIGKAACRLIESRPMIALFAEELRKDPGAFYSYRPSTYDLVLNKEKE